MCTAITTPDLSPVDVGTANSSSDLQTFARSASGEWEGVIATFNARGDPLELPERFVPSAYREWEVKVHDWQTLCSTQVTPEGGLRYGLKRMMPTVGCEADAVAFTEEAQQGLNPSAAGALPVLADGSYVLGPLHMSAEQGALRLESCLAGNAQGPLAARMRTRVVHLLKRGSPGRPWQLDAIEVHCEKYVAPYNGGAELAGCGGGQPAFATQPRLDAAELKSAVAGGRKTEQALHLVAGDAGLTEGAAHAAAWDRLGEDGAQLILLPKGIATSVRSEAGSDLEVAVLQITGQQPDRTARGACVTFQDGCLTAVSLEAASVVE